jgi:2-oxoglutarate/2-oxoacid ferredoxin oxidoreductase subunit alpha
MSRKPNIISSLHLDPNELENHNIHLHEKYDAMIRNEVRYELFNFDRPEAVVVAYGTTARVVKSAIGELKRSGIEVGLLRPITLWPFPYDVFKDIGDSCSSLLCVEMSMGQMIDDVRIGACGRFKVEFLGHCGGIIPSEDEIIAKILDMIGR